MLVAPRTLEVGSTPIDTGRLLGVVDKVASMGLYGSKLPKGEGIGFSAHWSFRSYGLTAALYTVKDGVVQEGNFDRYKLLGSNKMPTVNVAIIDSDEAPTGIGAPPLPPVAPALTNAIFMATAPSSWPPASGSASCRSSERLRLAGRQRHGNAWKNSHAPGPVNAGLGSWPPLLRQKCTGYSASHSS